MLPRLDIARANIDYLHAKSFNGHLRFETAHKKFVSALQNNVNANDHYHLSYAKEAYHADIVNIEQHFTVEANGPFFDMILVTSERGSNTASSKRFYKSYRCAKTAMNTCHVVNALFDAAFAS